jgi:acetyl esterase/lipase
MGSSYFYLEFLLVWLSLLKSVGYRNPAIFALEYTLVPDACYPTQLQEVITGYNYILSMIDEPSKICVAGDSAGATIILSLLLHLARSGQTEKDNRSIVPGMAVLISPWVTLVSSKDKNTASDYLDAKTLQIYARQYAGTKISTGDSRVSPGNCKDVDLWAKASPTHGFFITYGAEEIFAPEIRDLIRILVEAGTDIDVEIAKGGIHAWPVAALFLSSTTEKRQRGLKSIVDQIWERMD